jgi:hypothetical protein
MVEPEARGTASHGRELGHVAGLHEALGERELDAVEAQRQDSA